jgi:hypothetical protein
MILSEISLVSQYHPRGDSCLKQYAPSESWGRGAGSETAEQSPRYPDSHLLWKERKLPNEMPGTNLSVT